MSVEPGMSTLRGSGILLRKRDRTMGRPVGAKTGLRGGETLWSGSGLSAGAQSAASPSWPSSGMEARQLVCRGRLEG